MPKFHDLGQSQRTSDLAKASLSRHAAPDYSHYTGLDRRLPLLVPVDQDDVLMGGYRLVQSNDLEGSEHLWHLGAHMVCPRFSLSFIHIQVFSSVHAPPLISPKSLCLNSDKSKLSKLLQECLGDTYCPNRDWTSSRRVLSGHEAYKEVCPEYEWAAEFTLREYQTRRRFTDVVLEYGCSRTSGWETHIRDNRPAYHLDLAVSPDTGFSCFALSSAALERVRNTS